MPCNSRHDQVYMNLECFGQFPQRRTLFAIITFVYYHFLLLIIVFVMILYDVVQSINISCNTIGMCMYMYVCLFVCMYVRFHRCLLSEHIGRTLASRNCKPYGNMIFA